MIHPKKRLGQHFLRDENIAQKIVGYLNPEYPLVLEIGPGMGSLTKYILANPSLDPWFMEVDRESADYLKATFPSISNRIIIADFLKYDLGNFPETSAISNITGETMPSLPKFTIIGNFPYNISSQILFKALENRDRIPEVIGMFQKEVAERIASPPGNKKYGIISVLLQAFYDIEYLFTVSETVFYPPPKVKSAVIRLRRNKTEKLDCEETLFIRVVKTAFNQRRKTLRNALRTITGSHPLTASPVFDLRAEQLGVEDFVRLVREISTFAQIFKGG
ncbi:MAG: 16S rRNA (adenine(1518)-N(6)/adenine(1519)-N(6))-dimethyltransferase RsmA [Bacteroidetes bacterium]|nr:16S rRNA (adenine(1518)-N(6)/adenine(1519)-N(6))-dimethyltransferase RsmA [Bacteroidota bacterium]